MNSQNSHLSTVKLQAENKNRPTPFMGAASIVLKTGGAVLGLIAKAIRGSFSLLRPRAGQRSINQPHKMNDTNAGRTFADADRRPVKY
jgi:hypothetical protein